MSWPEAVGVVAFMLVMGFIAYLDDRKHEAMMSALFPDHKDKP